MNINGFDSYQDISSPVHRMDARVKVIAALLFILIVSLAPFGRFSIYVGLFTVVMICTLFANLDPLQVVKRSLIALPFAGAAITLIFTVPGETLATVPLVGWPISAPGLVRFASIVFKSVIAVQAATLLIMTTRFTDTLWALSAMRVPSSLIAIAAFMYRYSFVLAAEATRLTRAREARSAELPGVRSRGRSVIFNAQITGQLIGNLLIRSFARSERVYQAMAARGFKGEMKRLDHPALTGHDLALGALPVLVGALLLAGGFFIG
ncbi:MAG: cobalt ECF transporter T component CbiQ [Anaerolineae bacterium]